MTFIQTRSGANFPVSACDSITFDIEDIAHALSNICRFTGHTREFYSVAQHSVLCAEFIQDRSFAFEALMHDAHEAYIGDVSAPLKSLLPDFKAIERRIESAMRLQFGLPLTMSKQVREVDMMMLVTERRDMLGRNETRWPAEDIWSPFFFKIKPWAPAEARSRFLHAFQELKV